MVFYHAFCEDVLICFINNRQATKQQQISSLHYNSDDPVCLKTVNLDFISNLTSLSARKKCYLAVLY